MGRRDALLSLILSLGLMPLAAAGDVLTYAISPDSNPAHAVSCRVELLRGQIIAVEVKGSGMPPRHPFRWPAGRREQAAMRRGLGALLSGDLPSVERYGARLPAVPYVTVMWSSMLNGAPVSGLYMQEGLRLPAALAGVLTALLPGSACEAAVN